MNFGEILVQAVLPVVQSVGQQKLVELLQGIHTKKPDVYAQLLVELYPLIDIQLEGFTQDTTTKIDDSFVLAFKGAIEMSAASNGVALPNLDAGQIGD